MSSCQCVNCSLETKPLGAWNYTEKLRIIDVGRSTFSLPQLTTTVGTRSHPYVTMCHIGFRSAALLTYLFCGWFSDSFISSFVTVMLFLSADFWTVKNITGRLMVGLRWWNYIDDDGNSHWVYESKKNMVNKTESRIFWTTLFGFPVLWGLMIIGALLSFRIKWLLLAAIAATLNGANLYGYLKCKFGKNEDVGGTLSSMTSNFIRQRVMESAVSMMNQPNQAQQTKPAFGSPTSNVV